MIIAKLYGRAVWCYYVSYMSGRRLSSVCRNCKKEFKSNRNSFGIYCSNSCQQDYQNKIKLQNWSNGKDKGWCGKTRMIKRFIRKYLFDKFNHSCCKCGWNQKHPVTNKIPLEVNHIDGNAENCIESNLELLCPNHHSLTPNFRNLNKNSKRIR